MKKNISSLKDNFKKILDKKKKDEELSGVKTVVSVKRDEINKKIDAVKKRLAKPRKVE